MTTARSRQQARTLLGIDQKTLAGTSNVSSPTILRLEACDGSGRGNIGTLSNAVTALETTRLGLIGEYSRSKGDGRNVPSQQPRRPLDLKRSDPMTLKKERSQPARSVQLGPARSFR